MPSASSQLTSALIGASLGSACLSSRCAAQPLDPREFLGEGAPREAGGEPEPDEDLPGVALGMQDPQQQMLGAYVVVAQVERGDHGSPDRGPALLGETQPPQRLRGRFLTARSPFTGGG